MEDEAPSQGLIAGKYELVGLIGRGGMGSVWEGRHVSLGTRVAIKFIESEYANSQEARMRFDKEARAAARIQSKHAIQIFDHGVTQDGKPFIVMEYLQGEPLDKRIERMGRMSLQETARILQQVCRGLARAHEQGIIHRDLKPENIFLVRSHDDDDEIAKVLDFGIAKDKGPSGSGSGGISSTTKTGAVLGTPFYMSPEQARGLRSVDHRTDIWSLGVIAYKCVTGVLPFEGESVGDLLVKICTSPLPIPSQFLPGLPQSFDTWFARALERDTERRFATALELSDALAYAAGVSVRRAQSAPDPRVAGYAPTAPLESATNVLARPGYTPHGNATPRPPSNPPPASMAQSQGQPAAPVYPQGAGATSAPFTAGPRTQSSSRGVVLVSSLVAALLAGGVGFFVFTRMSHRTEKPEVSVNVAATKPGPAATSVTAIALPPKGDEAVDAGSDPKAGSGVAAVPSATAALAAATANGKPHKNTRPPPPPHPPTTSGGPTTPLPPPPKPPPTSAAGDPGY